MRAIGASAGCVVVVDPRVMLMPSGMGVQARSLVRACCPCGCRRRSCRTCFLSLPAECDRTSGIYAEYWYYFARPDPTTTPLESRVNRVG